MIFCNEPNKRIALDCKEFVKYLGILIDNHLSWKHHIDLVKSKLVKRLNWSLTYDILCQEMLSKTFFVILLQHIYVMVWWPGTKHVNRILTSFFSFSGFFIFDRTQHTIPLFTDAGM